MKFVLNHQNMYEISNIINAIDPAQVSIYNPSATIDVLAYDTRKIRQGIHALFFALKGQMDGHNFVQQAYEKDVRNFVISDLKFSVENFPEANFIWVTDSLAALQAVALFHRNSIAYPIIGITGSNGKTIVKEWLSKLLMDAKRVYQSPKSYNSQMGVALSLWKMPQDADWAIIEAGISEMGEMSSLQRIIKPNWGIFTSLGTAHRAGFVSKLIKLEEKWNLFVGAEKIIAPSSQLPESYLADTRVVSWGERSGDALRIGSLAYGDYSVRCLLYYKNTAFELNVPFIDKASLDNVLTCVLTLLEMGFSVEYIYSRVEKLKPLDMRLQLKKGKNNSSIIDDTYSNDLASLEIALDFLSQQNQYKYKKIIISDFEGEEWTPKFELKLQNILQSVKLDSIIFVGQRFSGFKPLNHADIKIYESSEELLNDYENIDITNSIVLIKGARKYKLEELSKKFSEKSHETILQINLKSLEHNLKQYRSKLSSKVKMMAMVKAFSYGSGSFEVANILQFNNIDYLTVAFADEGVELRRAGVKVPIMVLSPHESAFEEILKYNLEPEIYSIRILKSFVEVLKSKNIHHYPIHIKLDTGMHRLGFMENEVDPLIDFLLLNKEIVQVKSAFSHLVGADNPELADFTVAQIALYKLLSSKIQQSLGYSLIQHICNTSGIVHQPHAHMDMVRLGIGLYGYDANPKDLVLEEVGVLKTTITQIKFIPKDETIGYDRQGVLSRDSKIATVKIGYADGYNRRFGNGIGMMSVHGNLVKTVGNICMDMCMLDITDIDAKEGDVVIVFPYLSEAAKSIGTIPYELLTSISSRVKRVYYYE